MLKFMWNGIKVDGELYKAWYFQGKLVNYPEGTFTIYAREYERFPKTDGLNAENGADTMTDYFEKDRIRVTPDNKYYSDIVESFKKQEAHRQRRFNKVA